VPHNFRISVWISANFTRCSLRDYHNYTRLPQVLRKMDSEILTVVHKTQRMASVLTFLERCHEDGNEFLHHIVRVRGDETWISLPNVETKERSKQWMHTHSPSKTKKFKQTSACQNADSNCFLELQRSADGGFHVTRVHNNVSSVLRNTKKSA
jgi:hypothetical protein